MPEEQSSAETVLDVAFSYDGSKRELAKQVRDVLVERMPHVRCYIDDDNIREWEHFFREQQLRSLLPRIYDHARLMVVFFSLEYPGNPWPGTLEWSVIADRIMREKLVAIIFKWDDAPVPEGLPRDFRYETVPQDASADKIADIIVVRLQALDERKPIAPREFERLVMDRHMPNCTDKDFLFPSDNGGAGDSEQ